MSLHIVGNIHPAKVYANSCQTVCITGEKMKWQKDTKVQCFYITVKELAKSGVSQLKEPCVMCHLTLQYSETNLYMHIMLLMTSLTSEIKL